MSAQPLPDRPNLDQLKRQAKELLAEWRTNAGDSTPEPRLRDAQRAIAQRYGFDSWDALRERVTQADATRPRRGMDYDDPVPDVVELSGPLTREAAARLAERGVTGVKPASSVDRGSLAHLLEVPALRRLDLSGRDDLTDDDLAFLAAMPLLTAVSLARCGGISDRGVAHLQAHQALEQINLQWTATGDGAVAALAGKPSLSRVALGARLTDDGAERLREFPALTVPGLPDTFLSVSSARTLTDRALATFGALQGVLALDVHMSVFGSPHYTARGVAHLAGMTSLEELNFHGPLATDEVLGEIARIPALRHLHCQDPVSGDDGFVALAQRITLEVLSGRVCPRMTSRGFAALARLTRLRSLGLGGPHVGDEAMAAFADAPALADLGPIMFGDAAFVHIARMPNLQRLSNMYNRATTDAATRCLRGHTQLREYSAFGTQITDESLRILAGVPTIEALGFESCGGITDAGLREVAQLPRLRRISVWDCVKVTGAWTDAVRPGVDAKSEPGPPGHAAGYRAETLMDYPDLPGPEDFETITAREAPAISVPLQAFGPQVRIDDGILHLAVEPGADTRWIGLVTREAFRVPMRIEIEVRPIDELRLRFGSHNRHLAFDQHGAVANPTPWFLTVDARRGRAVAVGASPLIAEDEWTLVRFEVDDHEQRLFVNGVLRHTWGEDASGMRTRVGIGVRERSLHIRSFRVEALGA